MRTPEMALVGFAVGEELFGQFGHVIEGEAGFVGWGEGAVRREEFGGIQIDQLTVLFLIVRDRGVGQAFEAGAVAAFGFAGPAGYASKFALIASEEADDEVGFAERVGAEDEAFAQASGHCGGVKD